jgi:hypothetical protein
LTPHGAWPAKRPSCAGSAGRRPCGRPPVAKTMRHDQCWS